MIFALARKSMSARKGRNIFIFLVVGFVVSFVAAAFVLTDSLGAGFDTMVEESINATSADVIIRVPGADDPGMSGTVDPSVLPEVSALPGVRASEGDYIRPIAVFKIVEGGDDVAVGGNGPPTFGRNYPVELPSSIDLVGKAPVAADEVVLTSDAADSAGLTYDGAPDSASSSTKLRVITAGGAREMTIVGLVVPKVPSTGAAVEARFAPDHAGEILGVEGGYDRISLYAEDGTDAAKLIGEVEATVPDGLQAISGAQLTDEIQEEVGDVLTMIVGFFRIGLLAFAAISGFVGAFIINNMISIAVGQRMREVALLRAVGASSRQVRNLILLEAGLVAGLSTLAGLLGGILLGVGLLQIVQRTSLAFPDTPTVVSWPAIVFSIITGLGVVLLSAWWPSRAASRIPPVAAMRPRLGFQALSTGRRLGAGLATLGIGAVLFLAGLFLQPFGGWVLAVMIGLGAAMIFLGAASLSKTVAGPVSKVVGWPIARFSGEPGVIARDNAMREPRRTARTASALMIGVAILCAATVFASSAAKTIGDVLGTTIKADYVVDDPQFGIVPMNVAEGLTAVPEVETVSVELSVPVSLSGTGFDGKDANLSVIEGASYDSVVNLDLSEGSYDDMMKNRGVGVFEGTATDLGLSISDTVTLELPDQSTAELPIAMIFSDDSLGTEWVADRATIQESSSLAAEPDIVWVKAADGANAQQLSTAVEQALSDFPELRVQDQAEFQESASGQVDLFLTVVTVLLAGALILSFVGIAVTLAMSVMERTREIGLLRSVGMTRKQMRRTIQWEAVIVVLFGSTVGLVMGMAIGLALVGAAPASIASQVSIPFIRIVVVLVLASVGALIAAVYPATKAARMNVLRAIRTE